MDRVIVIGGGLAGSEAAWQIAKRGIKVILYEMRPVKMTEAHRTGHLAELVCSNSLKSVDILNASGLLKEELRRLGSLIIEAAQSARIPGGKALVVDRERFAQFVTERLENHPNIDIRREEVKEIPKGEVVIVATGPLTSESLIEDLKKYIGEDYLYFYDALSPIVSSDSLDFSKLYRKDRHGWEESAYLNAPMNEEEYKRFYEALVNAEIHESHEFEKDIPYFESCLPIEVMAKRGPDTLRYGPLRPKGLKDPRTGREPYAVVQLRPENEEETAFSLVGFQTQLKIREQERVFRMIPGLEKAVFLRYGAVHRNTYINAPKVIDETLELKEHKGVFIAGQLVGTEGYVEAAMGGLFAGINAFLRLKGRESLSPPRETMCGALLHYISHADPRNFQPMNANFGLFKGAPPKLKWYEKRKFYVERALKVLERWMREVSSEIF